MSSKQKTSSTTNVDMGPWKVQQPYLTDAFSEAKSLYNNTKNTPGYQGDFYANLNDTQKNLIGQGTNFFQNQGFGSANNMMNTGNTMLSSGSTGLDNSAAGLYGLANSDLTGDAITQASRFAQGMKDAGLVNSLMRPDVRAASESIIPNMYRQNAMTGNINSDRAALAQGVVERGLAEKEADINAGLYSTGLGLAQNNQAQQLDALAKAAASYGTLTGQGADISNMGFNNSSAAIGNALDFQNLDLQDRQTAIQNAFEKQQYGENRPYDLLNRYYGLVGSQNWGQQGTQVTNSTTTSSPGAASIIGGVLGGLGSLFGGGGIFGSFGAGSALLGGAKKAIGG